jgi:multicomponent Na+:H+ antiporter subunit G
MRQLSIVLLLAVGTLFTFLAALGGARMPDIFLRMQAMTKAAAFGLGVLFVAAAVAFEDLEVTARCLAAIALMLATMPISAQLIARAAILSGVRLWERTVVNELERGREQAEPPKALED